MIPERFKSIKLSNFDYLLPEERIAQKPMGMRDESKLLVYKDGEITNYRFCDLPELLPSNCRLILNNAKVIPARLHFISSKGDKIEVFLLEPESPYTQMELALMVTDNCVWHCMIGNLKRWKENEILTLKLNHFEENILLNAKLVSRKKQLVQLRWEGEISFSSVLELAGKIPLPPYIKREADADDSQSYQTVFAKLPGAVVAPTAGLHFSNEVFDNLKKKQIETTEVTLYVGAGTFAPVKVEAMMYHEMHAEMFSVNKNAIDQLLEENNRIAVGTTSLRTLESLYWIGVKLHNNMSEPFFIEKLFPYSFPSLPLTWNESLNLVKQFMMEMNLEILTAQTAIMIMPGYKFTSVNGLITNFHYPNTTLIMLVAAFIGDDWQKVYSAALDNNYRFLSYGDSSLLWANQHSDLD